MNVRIAGADLEVYAITRAGYVHHFGDAHNSFGGAMHVWIRLAEELGHLPPHDGSDAYKQALGAALLASPGESTAFSETWKAVDDPQLEDWKRVVLASTFDRVVVFREDLPILIDALARWVDHYRSPLLTLRGERALLEELLAHRRPTYRGACFNQTSVVSDAWPRSHGRPFNIDESGGWVDLFGRRPELRP